jgi:hypothetical protein
MPTIDPKNLTAQLQYRAAGNPPSTSPAQAIANCFPGLEFDFRNLWRRILVGIVLHEADNLVVAVDPAAPAAVQGLLGQRLISVGGVPTVTVPMGPRSPGGPSVPLGDPPPNDQANLEWTNALADAAIRPGTKVRCVFQSGGSTGPRTEIDLEVRALLDREVSGGSIVQQRAVVSSEAVEPGELTQSLCSPWQNDYRECGCYYWAASRPDYVNVDTSGATSVGHNWLQKGRAAATPKVYSTNMADLVTYEELFRDWANLLRFIIGGNDEPTA